MKNPAQRSDAFCKQFGLRHPVLLGPMAGVPAPALSIAVAQAGGLGACGALLMQPQAIVDWAAQVRSQTHAPFQINLWIPDPPPLRDTAHEASLRDWLADWGPAVPFDAGDAAPPSFESQCEALLTVQPAAVSSVMGLFPPAFVERLKAAGIHWFANVSTVAEARAAQIAGADAIVAQGMEAGGHRGCFDAAKAEAQQVGLMALLPAVVDAVDLPVVATGVVLRPHLPSVQAQCRLAPVFCVHRKRACPAVGPMLWRKPGPKTPNSPVRSAVAPDAVWSMTMFVQPPQRTRRNQHLIPCSVGSPVPCAQTRPAGTSCAPCKRGRGSPLVWQWRCQRPRSSSVCVKGCPNELIGGQCHVAK